MPLYEYNCPRCKKQFELLIRGREKPKCPHCGSAKLEKLFSTFGAKTDATAPCGQKKSSVQHCCGGQCCH